ncbi:short transient receptor potential channel 4-like [Amphiura filiformis]|uniref:short transient receptor potential channel 4-like n=1 Tax=Amphiura filiformis TaxID=82378 RepID=UPI003B20F125
MADTDSDSKPGDVLANAIVKGDLALVDMMLKERHTNGLKESKYQNTTGNSAYTVAIQEGYVVMVQMMLKYDVPLGDALLRAVDADFMDAVEEICSYARKHPELRETILNCRCDNGDLHPRFTPIILAAYNNNFEIVEILIKMGAFIPEPDPNKSTNTLEETHDLIDIYKALCSEAYISLASVDPIDTAFGLCRILQNLSNLMPEFSAQFIELADRVRQYAGDILGQCRSTEEIMAIMTYEANQNSREAPEGTRFLLVKLLSGIEFNQKEFVAHPNCQQILITHFYRGLSSYRDWNTVKQLMFTVLMLLGYPVISLIYLFIPSMKIKRFVRIPFVKFLFHTGADMSFLAVLVVISYSAEITPTVNFMINYAVLFTVGLAWKHCKEIMDDGLMKYLSNGRNLIDTLILILYTSAFMVEAAGSHRINTEVPQYRLQVQEKSLLSTEDFQSSNLKHHNAFPESETKETNVRSFDLNFDLPNLDSLDILSSHNELHNRMKGDHNDDKQKTGSQDENDDSLDSKFEDLLTISADYSSSRPDYSNSRPVFSSSRPDFSSSGPDYSSSVPDYSSSVPDYSSSIPDYSSSIPDYSSTGPDYSSSIPDYSSSIPDYSSTGPDYSSSIPDYSSSRPDYSSSRPDFSGSGPDYSSSLPDYSSSVPDYSSSVPDYSSSVPDYSSSIPDYSSTGPDYSSSIPDYSSSRPDYSSSRPDYSSSRPGYSSSRPDYSSSDQEFPSYRGSEHKDNSEQSSDAALDSMFDLDQADLPSATSAGHGSRLKRSTSTRRGSGGISDDSGNDLSATVKDGEENIYTLDANDPRVVSRVLFGVVGLCVTIRLFALISVSETIGPLQISLSAMGTDIIKFCIVYAVILLAFAVGLTQIYAPYLNAFHIRCIREGGGSSCVKGKFATFASSLETLFWILLGFMSKNDTLLDTDHTIIKFTGIMLYAFYLVLGVIVLLNVLIAMMGTTYTTVEENADMEWKFSRSKLWTSYLMLGSALPPPFNLILSLKTLKRIIYNACCHKLAEEEYKKSCDEKAKMAQEIADEQHYKRVLKTLVGRFVQHEATDDNNAEAPLSLQDVRGLRNDIIAFR